jgi:hypothetical protein
MKLFNLFFILFIASASAQEPKVSGKNPIEEQKRPEGKYTDEADSIRKKHLTPHYADTIERSKTDRMPVKPDTGKSDPNMPVARPRNNEHMPVKELSDTSGKK